MPKPGAWAMHLTIHGEVDAAATWSNMPSANTFLFGSHRHIMLVDISGMAQVRLKVNKQGTAGASGAKLRVCWSPSFSTSVGSYVDLGATEVAVDVNVTNTFLDSGWVNIHPAALGEEDVYLAIVGSGGDGVLDPQFGTIAVAFQ